ncbi:MAG: ABC transporter substrate-binding protein, partial [Thermomicrobiales bacterium]
SRRSLITKASALGLSAAIAGSQHGAVASPLSRPGSSVFQAQTTKLQFFHDKTPWQGFFEKMSEQATKEIDVGWEATPYADTTSYQQVINSSLPTGSGPDLFTWWSGYRMEDMYNSGQLLDVSAIWQAAIKAGDLPESLSAGFTFNDKQYGIPAGASYWVMFYNKHVFGDNGLKPPTTWDEFTGAAEKIKAAGVTPFFATVDGRWPAFIWWEELLIKSDPQFYIDLCNGKAKYTDPPAVKAMATWKDFIDKKYFTDLDLPMDSNMTALFAKNEIAMVPVGTWFQQQFTDAGMKPGTDYDIFIIPNSDAAVKQNSIIVESGAICLPAKGKNTDAAQKVATWWDQVPAQTTWSGLLGDTPANPKVKTDNEVLNTMLKTVTDNKYVQLQRYWEASPPSIVENAVDELARFMLNPNEGQSVLEAIQKIADDVWSKRKAG